MPIIFVLCVVGRFSIAQRLFDVWTMLGVAVANWFLRRNGYHPAPFVLGDLMDKSLRRGLVISDGDLSPFFTQPISAVLAVIVVITLVMSIPAGNSAVRRLFRRVA